MKEDKNLSSKKERNDIIRLSENDLDNNYEDVKEVNKSQERERNNTSSLNFNRVPTHPDDSIDAQMTEKEKKRFIEDGRRRYNEGVKNSIINESTILD